MNSMSYNETVPREMNKANLSEYVVEPPDILLINAVRVLPLGPYRVESLDSLFIQVNGVLPNEPISGVFPVDPDGFVNLGSSYGSVRVFGQTLAEAKETIEAQLRKQYKKAEASIALAQSRGGQQISGEHLVRPDGSVSLGIYGNVIISKMTLTEAKAAIEAHLSQFLQRPEITLDVLAYNSKILYVIFDGGGNGQQLVRLPVTGNETVLDAISQVNGLTAVSSTDHIWVARPGPAGAPCDQILNVDWYAVTARGRTETNYQLFPGDRLYVKAQTLITIDTFLGKLLSPVERVLGITLLGSGTVHSVAEPLGTSSGTGGGF